MPSAEDFDALKKRVDDLEGMVHRLTSSHKDVLEKYLPEATNALNEYIGRVAATQADVTNKLTGTMEFVAKLSSEIEGIQTELELRTDL
jgi:hypothetical protein